MKTVSLVGTASRMPETVVDNTFYGGDAAGKSGMFKGSRFRRHMAKGETATSLIADATKTLADRLNLRPEKDVDILLTNVSCPDVPFTGCGASVAKTLGLKPQWVLDLHNTGCISFVYMMGLARSLMATTGAKSALLCNVQSAAGRVFRHDDNRKRPQSAVPGDGCGVGYMVANAESPVRSIVTRVCPEYADDMRVVNDQGTDWWEPHESAMYIDFTEARVAAIVGRANSLVPGVLREACRIAEVPTSAVDVLVTNQPNAWFLRNWREALQVKKEAHVDTFEEHGNLFGAAIPVCIERAEATGRLQPGHTLAIGGFSHAGDYAAAAIVHWRPS